MCGYSKATINETSVSMHIGYLGGVLKINKEVIYDTHYDEGVTRKEAMKQFRQFKKEELINILLDFIDNAEEGDF